MTVQMLNHNVCIKDKLMMRSLLLLAITQWLQKLTISKTVVVSVRKVKRTKISVKTD